MMNTNFLSDGPKRALHADGEQIRKAIAAKYADQLATAGLLRRLMIRYAMFLELRRAGHSRYTLWSRR